MGFQSQAREREGSTRSCTASTSSSGGLAKPSMVSSGVRPKQGQRAAWAGEMNRQIRGKKRQECWDSLWAMLGSASSEKKIAAPRQSASEPLIGSPPVAPGNGSSDKKGDCKKFFLWLCCCQAASVAAVSQGGDKPVEILATVLEDDVETGSPTPPSQTRSSCKKRCSDGCFSTGEAVWGVGVKAAVWTRYCSLIVCCLGQVPDEFDPKDTSGSCNSQKWNYSTVAAAVTSPLTVPVGSVLGVAAGLCNSSYELIKCNVIGFMQTQDLILSILGPAGAQRRTYVNSGWPKNPCCGDILGLPGIILGGTLGLISLAIVAIVRVTIAPVAWAVMKLMEYNYEGFLETVGLVYDAIISRFNRALMLDPANEESYTVLLHWGKILLGLPGIALGATLAALFALVVRLPVSLVSINYVSMNYMKGVILNIALGQPKYSLLSEDERRLRIKVLGLVGSVLGVLLGLVLGVLAKLVMILESLKYADICLLSAVKVLMVLLQSCLEQKCGSTPESLDVGLSERQKKQLELLAQIKKQVQGDGDLPDTLHLDDEIKAECCSRQVRTKYLEGQYPSTFEGVMELAEQKIMKQPEGVSYGTEVASASEYVTQLTPSDYDEWFCCCSRNRVSLPEEMKQHISEQTLSSLSLLKEMQEAQDELRGDVGCRQVPNCLRGSKAHSWSSLVWGSPRSDLIAENVAVTGSRSYAAAPG